MRYEVKDVVCDYGVYENGTLIPELILNSRANALLIADILNADTKHKVHARAKRGYWITKKYEKPLNECEVHRCSECGTGWFHKYNFCPFCGIKMYEVNNNG